MSAAGLLTPLESAEHPDVDFVILVAPLTGLAEGCCLMLH